MLFRWRFPESEGYHHFISSILIGFSRSQKPSISGVPPSIYGTPSWKCDLELFVLVMATWAEWCPQGLLVQCQTHDDHGWHRLVFAVLGLGHLAANGSTEGCKRAKHMLEPHTSWEFLQCLPKNISNYSSYSTRWHMVAPASSIILTHPDPFGSAFAY